MTVDEVTRLSPHQRHVVDAIAAARAERDIAFRTVDREDEQRGSWDRNLIDQAIDAFADLGEPFSANDVREVLPADVRTTLMGARFTAAAKAGLIQSVGLITSTKRNTHAKPVAKWIRVTTLEEQA